MVCRTIKWAQWIPHLMPIMCRVCTELGILTAQPWPKVWLFWFLSFSSTSSMVPWFRPSENMRSQCFILVFVRVKTMISYFHTAENKICPSNLIVLQISKYCQFPFLTLAMLRTNFYFHVSFDSVKFAYWVLGSFTLGWRFCCQN